VILALVATYFGWQGGRPHSLDELSQLGARNTALWSSSASGGACSPATYCMPRLAPGGQRFFLFNLAGRPRPCFAASTTSCSWSRARWHHPRLDGPLIRRDLWGERYRLRRLGRSRHFRAASPAALPPRYRATFWEASSPTRRSPSTWVRSSAGWTPGDTWAGSSRCSFRLPRPGARPDPGRHAPSPQGPGARGARARRRPPGASRRSCRHRRPRLPLRQPARLSLPIPARWRQTRDDTTAITRTCTFTNGAGVSVGLVMRRDEPSPPACTSASASSRRTWRSSSPEPRSPTPTRRLPRLRG